MALFYISIKDDSISFFRFPLYTHIIIVLLFASFSH